MGQRLMSGRLVAQVRLLTDAPGPENIDILDPNCLVLPQNLLEKVGGITKKDRSALNKIILWFASRAIWIANPPRRGCKPINPGCET